MPDKKPPKDSKFGNFFQNESGNVGYSMVAWSWSCRPQWGGGLQQMPMTGWIKCQCQGLQPLGLSLYISLYYIDWSEPEPTITFHIGWYHSSWNISSHSSPFQGCAQWTQIPRWFGCLDDAVKPWRVWGAPWKSRVFFHMLLGMIPRNDTKCIYISKCCLSKMWWVRNQKWDDTRSPITGSTADSNAIQPMCTVFWLLPLQRKPKRWWKRGQAGNHEVNYGKLVNIIFHLERRCHTFPSLGRSLEKLSYILNYLNQRWKNWCGPLSVEPSWGANFFGHNILEPQNWTFLVLNHPKMVINSSVPYPNGYVSTPNQVI